MASGDAELLMILIVIVVLALAPLASKWIAEVGGEISAELDGGRTGAQLSRHLDRRFSDRAGGGGEGAVREVEIRQLLEARAYVQQQRGEVPLDVEAELKRILRN